MWSRIEHTVGVESGCGGGKKKYGAERDGRDRRRVVGEEKKMGGTRRGELKSLRDSSFFLSEPALVVNLSPATAKGVRNGGWQGGGPGFV